MAGRADNEKKTITKSMKMSPDIVKHIENEAKKKNMNFSQYMIDRAVHGDNSLTPEILCRMENIIQCCLMVATINNSSDIENIRMEADALWECLK